MRFCMSSGVDAEPVLEELFLRLLGVAYVHDAVSPRLVQLSQGWPRLHFSLRCLQAPHDSGTRFLFRTTLNCGSGGEWPALDELVEGGVGGMLGCSSTWCGVVTG
jgi:hypothetical protein